MSRRRLQIPLDSRFAALALESPGPTLRERETQSGEKQWTPKDKVGLTKRTSAGKKHTGNQCKPMETQRGLTMETNQKRNKKANGHPQKIEAWTTEPPAFRSSRLVEFQQPGPEVLVHHHIRAQHFKAQASPGGWNRTPEALKPEENKHQLEKNNNGLSKGKTKKSRKGSGG